MTFVIVLETTIVLAAAWCATAALRGRSAALRHAIWTAALAVALLLPATTLLTPAWQPIAPMPEAAITVVAAIASAAPVPADPLPWLSILYAAGAALVALRFFTGAIRAASMVRRATPSTLGADYGVRVVTSSDAPMPIAWGIFRPVILLPTTALDWPADRLRAVLLHESMHHYRRDLLTQFLAQAACCLYWFHPLAWVAAARQRNEREHACDDAVLRHGVAPHDYAASLVDVVRSVASSRRQWSDAPAMAESSSLESRVRAVLDASADRRPFGRRAAAGLALAAAFILAPIAVINLQAQTGGATILGVVQDASGARVPNSRVTAKNLTGNNQEATRANAAGEYRFTAIPPGQYALEFSSAGFAVAKSTLDLVAGATARVDPTLEVGQMMETLTVSAPRLTAPAPAPARSPERIRVGGNVQPIRLLRQTRPAYPPELQQQGVEGSVIMRAIISTSGAVLHPQVVNSVDPRLAKAALDAVTQWQYEPALLNGQPVETATTITVEFQLGQ